MKPGCTSRKKYAVNGIIIMLASMVFSVSSFAQQGLDFFALPQKKQEGFLRSVNEKFSNLDKAITRKTTKTLQRLQKQEHRLYTKLYKKDSVAAKKLFANTDQQYAQLQNKLLSAGDSGKQKELKQYFSNYDTISTSLSFLQQKLPASSSIASSVQASKQVVQQFGSRMQVANEIKKQLRERKKLLADNLEKFGLTKQLKNLNKEVYYYQEQLNAYKELLHDKKKLEQKAIAALRNTAAFKDFMSKNSILAKMFQIPGTPASATNNVTGMQTIASVQAQINERFGNSGVNPQQYMRQQVNAAQGELNTLKSKLNKVKKASSNDEEMPKGYNSQKSKSFLKRLTYETNCQTQKIETTMADVSLTVGYKINDRSIISIGGAARVGLGKDWNNIRFTNEGFGLKSVLDWKVKHGIWMMGSYETNYYNRFSESQYNGNIDPWQANILLGLMKKIQINSKKTSTVRLAYNLMYKQNNFLTQPVVFKVGYGF
jgi:hypothetical protein